MLDQTVEFGPRFEPMAPYVGLGRSRLSSRYVQNMRWIAYPRIRWSRPCSQQRGPMRGFGSRLFWNGSVLIVEVDLPNEMQPATIGWGRATLLTRW